MAEISNESTEIAQTVNGDVEKVFKRFDTNGDGKISVKEMESILNAMGSRASVEDVERIMAELDVDGDGSIDLREFLAFHGGGGGDGGNSKELKEAFDLYDKDKNGRISETELHAVLRSLGENVSLEDCGRMIKSVDVDGDGCVNFHEFKKMMSM